MEKTTQRHAHGEMPCEPEDRDQSGTPVIRGAPKIASQPEVRRVATSFPNPFRDSPAFFPLTLIWDI